MGWFGPKNVKLLIYEALVRHLRREQDGPLHEWLVKLKWLKTFKQEDAQWFTRAFANQNVVCKLREPNTFKFLADKFELSIPD